MSGGATESVLRYEVSDAGVAVLLLDRPDKRNALNAELVGALREALERAAEDESVRVVALRGAGPDFCAGADLAEMHASAAAGPEANLRDARRLGDLLVAMRRHPRPVVSVVHGRALAGGCGLATACDLVLARQDAVFGYPETELGFVPAMVMAVLRRKVGEGRAFELVARGHRIGAEEARAAGLVNRVFEQDAFEDEVTGYLDELAGRPASALELTKRLLYGMDTMAFDEAVARGAEVNALARETAAARDGIAKFVEGRGGGARSEGRG